MHSRLAIEYGAATVRGILVSPGGVIMLPLDGGKQMSSAVHVSDSGIVAGAAAWQKATVQPDGFVVSPLRVRAAQVPAAGSRFDVVDLVAATLRHVAATARQMAGEPVEDVRLVVPAGWGPRRRTWLRHAAHAADLAVSRLIEAPIAALDHLAAESLIQGSGPDRLTLVIDVGAGCEVTVVRHGPAGPEVLSTLADPRSGGDQLDFALVQALTGSTFDDLPGALRWPTLATVRTARQTLTDQVAVTMPLPDGLPIVVNSAAVTEVARPVFERAGELARQALGNADLTVEQIENVWLIGGASVTPGAADLVAAKLGAAPRLPPIPQLTAVLGAAGAGARSLDAAPEQPLRLPPLRRLVTLALPGLASLALYAHFVLSADFNNGTPDRPRAGYYVLANWGELTLAAILATITCLQAASLFAALLEHHPAAPHPPAAARITAGIGLAIAAGLATTGLYAVTAAVFFNQPIAGLLRWTIAPVAPTVIAAATVAVLAWRRPTSPAGGWDTFLTYPASSMATATAGILAVSLWWHGPLPAWLNGWTASVGLAGGLLIGVAIACTLVRHPGARFAFALPLAFFATIISRTGPDILAVIYAIAVAGWWAWHTWPLIRPPLRTP